MPTTTLVLYAGTSVSAADEAEIKRKLGSIASVIPLYTARRRGSMGLALLYLLRLEPFAWNTLLDDFEDAELKAFFTSVAGLSSRTLTAMRAALAMEPTQAREVLSEAERQMGEVTDFHPKPQPTFESARDIERRIREKGLAIKVIEEAGKK